MLMLVAAYLIVVDSDFSYTFYLTYLVAKSNIYSNHVAN